MTPHQDRLVAFQSTYPLLWLIQEETKSFSTQVEVALTMNLIPGRFSNRPKNFRLQSSN